MKIIIKNHHDSVKSLQHQNCIDKNKITNKELEKEWKKLKHEKMKEEGHQIEFKEDYEQDEEYKESKD